MRPRRPISEEGKEALFLLLKQSKSRTQLQRVQFVWLRAALDLSAAQVLFHFHIKTAYLAACLRNPAQAGCLEGRT